VSATDGSEYKNIRNVFEQREALALMGERHGWQRIKKPQTSWGEKSNYQEWAFTPLLGLSLFD
jgi:hypothetical protein